MKITYTSSHHASLFGYLAREVYERHDDAEHVMEEAVIRYGMERGGRMRQRAIIDGLPLNMSTYLLYREYAVVEGASKGTRENMPDGDFHAMPETCAWSDKWKELGLCKYCGVYCRNVDRSLARGFDESCVLDSTANLTDGAPHCDLWFRGANSSQPENQEKMRTYGPKIKASNAIKDWDFHLAHTYSSIRTTLLDYYPAEETEEIMAAAVRAFEDEYGPGSAEDFLRLKDQDFIHVTDYEGVKI